MAKFRKKPVVIEAVQFDGTFPQGFFGTFEPRVTGHRSAGNATWLTIPTLEGDMTVQEGDWIIKGVQGEFYPCKPDIFAATYEPVEVTRHGD